MVIVFIRTFASRYWYILLATKQQGVFLRTKIDSENHESLVRNHVFPIDREWYSLNISKAIRLMAKHTFVTIKLQEHLSCD